MHQPLIIQHLFQVSSLEDVSRERLESFVESYPSYGIGHYLLSCKLQAEGSDRFLPETQRTCLYFSNPLWLQWLLQNSDATLATQQAGAPAASVVETVALEPVASYNEEGPVAAPVWEQAAETPIEAAPAEATYTTESVETINVAESIVDTPPVEATESPVENVVTMAEEAFGGPVAGDDLAEALTAPGTRSDGEGLSAAEQLLRSIEEARELRESLQKLQADGGNETALAGESLPTETEAIAEPAIEPEIEPEIEPVIEPAAIAETPVEHEAVAAPEEPVTIHEIATAPEEPVASEIVAPAEEPIRDQEVPFVLEEREAEPVAVAETPAAAEVQAVEVQAVVETPAAAGAPAVEEPQKQTVTATQDFLFEPYHTIDYFASQGIKLTLEENPSDTLGKQLKSFTDWLKTMRRLPQKDREVVPDRAAEQAVQTFAAHSVLGKDVVTETMAEVLAKQGMREKARAVYEKLSLLNPDKRAYFAAKIEQLNIP